MLLYKSLYLTPRFFKVSGALIALMILSFIFPALLTFGKLLTLLWILLVLLDILILYRRTSGLTATRNANKRFSNGDHNLVTVTLQNQYSLPLQLQVLDEIPYQFQRRDLVLETRIEPGAREVMDYNLRPTKRGEYQFGKTNVLARTVFPGMIRRRYQFGTANTVKVYPSYIQLRKYELLALAPNPGEYGFKKIRKLGHNMEFEHIKNYVPGDDYRAINWKATARMGKVMVNNYQDEKSQHVYCVIDKGRAMKMPFEGMSLMDYAINTSLVISSVALLKDDKAGIISYQHRLGSILPASSRRLQMKLILENLYHQKTSYKETNLLQLHGFVKKKITRRSLLLLFTNFETLSSMRRQLSHLKSIAKNHVLVVIFFKNTELFKLLDDSVKNQAAVYTQTIARKFAYEKKLIARELNHHGIFTVLCTPSELTISTLNKYLELKARGVI